MSDISIVHLQPEHAPALAALQRLVFPTLGEHEWLTEAHFDSHLRIFPEGDFVALDGELVVGLGAGFFTDFDLDHPQHTYVEMIGGGYFTTHNPDGAYYYGADISVHPDYRRRGIGSMLYEARKNLVRRYGKKGIIAGGALADYARHKDELSVKEYVDRVVAGTLYDATLSFQLRQGFVVRGILENYITDPETGNRTSLIVWFNPDFIDAEKD
jgi:ribosomal protein S18 acetylase RimI-like enzyme